MDAHRGARELGRPEIDIIKEAAVDEGQTLSSGFTARFLFPAVPPRTFFVLGNSAQRGRRATERSGLWGLVKEQPYS